MDTKTASIRWNCTVGDIREWCRDGKVLEAKKERGRWVIPDDAMRPLDRKLQKEILWQILEFENDNSCRIDLTQWGINDDSIVDYLSSLFPLCLRRRCDSNRPINKLAELQITDLGLAIAGRRYDAETADRVPKVIQWSAQVTGIFAASFVNSMIQQQLGIN